MKKIIAALCILVTPVLADSFPVEIPNVYNQTNSVSYANVSGELDRFIIQVTGVSTGTLTVFSQTGELLLTNTVSATSVLRPRAPTCDNTGTAYIGVSNNVERFHLVNDTLTFRLIQTAGVTNTYKITTVLKK